MMMGITSNELHMNSSPGDYSHVKLKIMMLVSFIFSFFHLSQLPTMHIDINIRLLKKERKQGEAR